MASRFYGGKRSKYSRNDMVDGHQVECVPLDRCRLGHVLLYTVVHMRFQLRKAIPTGLS